MTKTELKEWMWQWLSAYADQYKFMDEFDAKLDKYAETIGESIWQINDKNGIKLGLLKTDRNMEYDLRKGDLDHDLKWLKEPNNALNDYGTLVRHLLNEVGGLKQLTMSCVSNQREQLVDFGIWLNKNDKYLGNGNITETVKEYLKRLK